MPCTQPAPAVPGNQAPLQVPSLRRPLPANVPRTPRPINGRKREAKPLYPDLPDTPSGSGGTVTRAEFERAYFLRRLAEWRGAEKLLEPLYKNGGRDSQLPARLFLIGALRDAERELPRLFDDWMQACGGMAGPGFVTQ